MNYQQIKIFLATAEIPDSLDITPHGNIFNLPKFIKSHTEFLDGNPGNKAFLPYYNRLKEAVIKLKENISKKP